MYKRIFREILENWIRYLALMVMTIIAVGMYIGFLCGTSSSETAFVNYQTENKLEDGYFTLDGELDDNIRKDIEELDVSVYDNLYVNLVSEKDATVRVFGERTEVNLPYVAEGILPEEANEIFLDQIFALEQQLAVGDSIILNHEEYIISGVGAFPDYTISLEDSSQMIADRSTFGVAMVSEKGFAKFNEKDISYNYAVLFRDEALTESEQKDLMREIITIVACVAPIQNYGKLDEAFDKMSNAAGIENYTDTVSNKRISAVVSKMESNMEMAKMFVGVVFVIIAFLYMIFIKQTMNQECSVLGTLLALGVKKKDILLSYMLPPCIVTLAGSLIGCVLGSKVLYHLPVNSLESYYSIPKSSLNLDTATLLVAIFAPILLIIVINTIAIARKLSIKPLKLIRKDIGSKRSRNHSRFNGLGFDFRFRLRVFTQSLGAYFLLLVGIFLGGWLMMFGIGMSSSFDVYIEAQETEAVSQYQYMVSEQYEVDATGMEAATVGSFDYYSEALGQSYSLTGVGVCEDSKYFSEIKATGFGEIIVSDVAAKKFGIRVGDVIELENSATGIGDNYSVVDIASYNMGLAVFMNQTEMNNIFRKHVDYFNYYFSDTELDIPEEYLISVVTKDSLVANGVILKSVMQSMIILFPVMAVIVYLILMYLLINMILSQNETGISMLKIFGYTEKEISRMYIRANTIVVILLILITLPLQTMLMVSIWPACIATIPGFLDFVMGTKEFVIIVVTGIICYLISSLCSVYKIKKVSMTVMLKNQDR